MKKAIGTGKIFKGEELRVEGTVRDVLYPDYNVDNFRDLSTKCTAALIASLREKYTERDQPLYYAKMGNLGYIVAHDDLKFVEEQNG